MKVLSVDDDVVTHMMLGMQLDEVELIEAGRASEGFERATQDDPDAVVIDLRLPDGDGLDLVRRLRRHIGVSQIPIVVLTAGYDPANEAAAISAGADAYMAKPFDPHDVEAHLQAILKMPAGERRGRRRQTASALRHHEPVTSLVEPADDVEPDVAIGHDATTTTPSRRSRWRRG